MKKIVSAFLLLAALISLMPLSVFAAGNSSVSTLAELKTALAGNSETVEIAQDIDCGGETLTVNRALTLVGNGKTLFNAALSVENVADSVAVRNLNLTGAAAKNAVSAVHCGTLVLDKVSVSSSAKNGFFADGIDILTMTDCSVADSAEHGLYFIEGIGEITSLTSAGNAGGVAYLKENCQIIASGNPSHADLVRDDAAAEAIRESEQDKNISPDNELAVIFKYKTAENSLVAWKADNSFIKYIRKTVTIGGEEYQYVIIAYDNEAPEITLIRRPDVVIGSSVNVRDFFTVRDNREGEIALTYVVTAPGGTQVALTDHAFQAAAAGEYEIALTAEDRYGNAYVRRYYMNAVQSDIVKPVITNYLLKLDYTVGERLSLPNFTATDETAGDLPCQTEIYSPKGEKLPYASDLKLTEVGVYQLRVTASDGVNGSELVYRLTVSAKAGNTDVKNGLSPNAIAGIIIGCVFGAAVIAMAVLKIVFNAKQSKKAK